MSDFAEHHFARVSFLAIKVKSGTATAEEEAEYERTKRLRITETHDHAVLYVECPEMSVDEWKRMMPKANAEQADRLRALTENTVNVEDSASLDAKSGKSRI